MKKAKGILSIFNDRNHLGYERSSEKDAFKHLGKARVIITEVAGLHNAYPSRIISTVLRVWRVRGYLLGYTPFVGNDRGILKYFAK